MAAKDTKGKGKPEAKNAPKPTDEESEDGAEAAEGAAEGGAPKKRMAGRTLVLFIILPAVLLFGGGAAAHFMGLTSMLFGGASEADDHAEAAPAAHAPAPKGGHGGKAEAPKGAVFYDMPEMIVNLNSAGRRSSYLKISISLELQQSNDVAKVESVMPRIRDNFQTYLRELRIEDLRGSSGLFRLREELLSRVNVAAAPAKVNDVLFKEMLIQ